MTTRLYLHVGGPKSGTTYLQSVLRANRDLLAASGVAVVGERGGDLPRAGLIVREDPRVASMTPDEAGAWRRLVDQVRSWSGPAAVLSYELLAGASVEQVRAVMGEFPGIEVHVVITARDLARMVPSAWQERLKFRSGRPIGLWEPRTEEDGPLAEWGWRTMDPAAVAARWGVDLPPERVHVVTVPRHRSEPAELWDRFARATGLTDVDVDLAVAIANESLSPAAAEVLRQVNIAADGRLIGNREQKRWLRNVLAHRILVPLGDEPLGMTDAQFAEAEEVSERVIEDIRGRGYDVQGDLEELRATRPAGRLPGDVPAEEVTGVAARALYELLLLLRAEAPQVGDPVPAWWKPSTVAEADGIGEPPPGLAVRARRVARAVVHRAGAPVAQHRVQELTTRVAELETEVRLGRSLQRRVAELDDLVAELLLPAAEQDDEVLLKAVRRYRKGSV